MGTATTKPPNPISMDDDRGGQRRREEWKPHSRKLSLLFPSFPISALLFVATFPFALFHAASILDFRILFGSASGSGCGSQQESVRHIQAFPCPSPSPLPCRCLLVPLWRFITGCKRGKKPRSPSPPMMAHPDLISLFLLQNSPANFFRWPPTGRLRH